MKIGMIGGIGPESTVDYYQRLIKLYQININGDDYPEIIINSINMTAMHNPPRIDPVGTQRRQRRHKSLHFPLEMLY